MNQCLTREGNEIAPPSCNLRKLIAENTNTLCADCKHVLDMCKDIKHESHTVNGFNEVTWCAGFENEH